MSAQKAGVKANSKAKGNRDVALSSSCNINNSGGSLYAMDVPWLLNPVYVTKADSDRIEMAQNPCGLTDEKMGYMILSSSIYHPTESANEPFFKPTSWSSHVNISMPAGFAAGKTITGNDGQQYVEMRDSVTGEVVSHLGQYSCMRVDSGVFDPLKGTTPSLRDEADHFGINYEIDANGQPVRRSASEIAFRETMADIDNSATKLPNQLGMITIITNDVVAANNPKFQSAANSDIETPVAPAANFSGASVVFKPDAKRAPWVVPAAQNDALKFELQA